MGGYSLGLFSSHQVGYLLECFQAGWTFASQSLSWYRLLPCWPGTSSLQQQPGGCLRLATVGVSWGHAWPASWLPASLLVLDLAAGVDGSAHRLPAAYSLLGTT